MARLTKTAVKENIYKYNGNISAVARAFGKSRKWIYQYCKEKHPELWDCVEDARETMLDNAESQLYKNILSGKETSLIFYLKTQGKQRGYIEKTESEQTSEIIVRYDRSQPVHTAPKTADD